MEALRRNCDEFGIACFGAGHRWQGIVHVIGPELGPHPPRARSIVCGDSHTATHGAFGAFALGIGTSEVEHVLATQCLRQTRPQTMEVRIEGTLPIGVTAKDAALGVLNAIGTAGAAGHVVEYTGSVVRGFSMEQRMTLCNLTIEGGGRAGMIAPDATTFAYIKRRPYAPAGERLGRGGRRVERAAQRRGRDVRPRRHHRRGHARADGHLGHHAGAVGGGHRARPRPGVVRGRRRARVGGARARLHGARAGHGDPGHQARHRLHRLVHQRPHRGPARRRGDARRPARARRPPRPRGAGIRAGEGCRPKPRGSTRSSRSAGAEWRNPGCSMCLGMNPDILQPGERCASTSNRNFEGRQGRGGRTHLVSPAMAAAAAVEGRFVDVRRMRGRGGARMKPFRREDGVLIPLDRSDVDTDQIIPKQFLKRIERTGYGEFLFNDWRRDPSGAARPDFVLNQEEYAAGTVHGRGAQLRLRLVARARGVGARRLRDPRGHRRVVRRHLPVQRARQRAAPGDPAGARGARAASTSPPSNPGSPSPSTSRRRP